MVREEFLQLNPQMWGPASWSCWLRNVQLSREPESQLQTAELAESLEPREVAPSCQDGGSR